MTGVGVARGKVKLAEGGPVEEPWALPKGWRWKRLASIGTWGSGGTPKAKTAEFYGSGVPWYRIGDLNDGILTTSSERITASGLANSSAKIVPPGTLLIAMYGSIGKLGITSYDCATNQAIAFCLPNSAVVKLEYLFYFLLYRREHLASLGQGGTQQNISQTILLDELIAIPPLPMQEVLVERIDQLFKEVDDGEAALEWARGDLATWRKALLKAAVTGELTADWRAANPPTETGADLLARILTERRTRWLAEPRNRGKRYFEPMGPEVTDLPLLPTGWVWAGLEQLTVGGIRNGLSVKEAAYPTAVMGLRLNALQPSGINWTKVRHLPITMDRASSYLLSRGDLLISRANGSSDLVGRCSLVTEGRSNTVFPDTTIRYPLWGTSDFHGWVRTAWSAPQCRKRMLALAKSTAGILKISQRDIAAIALPLPPLSEIGQLDLLLTRLSDEANAAADDLLSLQEIPTALRQSILAAAFRGELVA